MSARIIGVDFGGVISDRAKNDGTDTSFLGENYLQTSPVPMAFESLKVLSSKIGNLVYIVSKCGLKTELKTRGWMGHHDFYRKTGINPEDVRFCRERPEKAIITDWHGMTHFIDDRLEVLSYLKNVPNKYLFGPQKQKENERYKDTLPLVTRVENWEELLKKI